ncbi:MAG: hypothetical protein HFF60_09550 [Oscillospiraceae bacterium]|jgi:deoxycytidine triphosphate deaminase|nr:hypothetical protein [Oscillospiraceae bacterium]
MCKGQLGRQDYIDERNREGGLRIEPFNKTIDLKLASYDITPTMIAMSAKCGLLETVYQKKDMSLYIKVRPRDTVMVVSNEFISVPPYMAGYVVSRVSKVADGFGHVSTSIDPNWQGALLIALSNPTNKPIEISVGGKRGPNTQGDSLATISFHYLNQWIEKGTPSDSSDSKLIGMRLDLLQKKKSSVRAGIKAALNPFLHPWRYKFTEAFFKYVEKERITLESWQEASKVFNGSTPTDISYSLSQYIVKETWRTRVLNCMKKHWKALLIVAVVLLLMSGILPKEFQDWILSFLKNFTDTKNQLPTL